MQTYNKLVRDNIIDIIQEKDVKVSYEVLDDKKYEKELNKKLQEEINEFLEDYSIEEMADVLEVIYAILDYRNITIEEIEKIRLDKRSKRGAFKNRIFLKTVDE